jgi:hypothetical protein
MTITEKNKLMQIGIMMLTDIREELLPYTKHGVHQARSEGNPFPVTSFKFIELGGKECLHIDKGRYLKFKEKYEKLGFKVRIGDRHKKYSKNIFDYVYIYNGKVCNDNQFIRITRYKDDNYTIIINVFGY